MKQRAPKIVQNDIGALVPGGILLKGDRFYMDNGTSKGYDDGNRTSGAWVRRKFSLIAIHSVTRNPACHLYALFPEGRYALRAHQILSVWNRWWHDRFGNDRIWGDAPKK